MEYHLDREIRLVEETQTKALFSWSLQEFSKEGEALARKLFPWKWSADFNATDLTYVRRFEAGSGEELIRATLKPDERYPTTKYSMFGTDRVINKFSATIRKLQSEEATEECTAWGEVSNTYEIDFRSRSDDDSIWLSILLHPKNYDALCYFAKQGGNQDEVFLSVSGVSGFYSEWSPEVSTSSIKILTSGQEQKVIRPEGHDEPPRLGKVSEFRLYFSRQTTLAAPKKQDDDADDFAPQSLPAAPVHLLEPIHKLQTTLEKLRIPLWVIVVLLAWMILR
jgi:hypothetical protein